MNTYTIFVVCYGIFWIAYILTKLFFRFLYSHPWFFDELFENVRRFFINIICRCLPGSISAKLYDRFLNEHEEISIVYTEYEEFFIKWFHEFDFEFYSSLAKRSNDSFSTGTSKKEELYL